MNNVLMNSVTDYVTKLVISDKQINNIITLFVIVWKSMIYDDIRLCHFSMSSFFYVLFFIEIDDKQKKRGNHLPLFILM